MKSSEVGLVLTADRTAGVAALTVHFTGLLEGDIDTLVLCVPDMVLCPGFGGVKSCILYCPPDTTQPAKRSYSADATYISPGDYKAVMVLQTGDGQPIYYDSLAIHVSQ
jgi:hypothetical protein